MRVDSGFGGKRARIEMIALIDVVFLLLVFFIYAMLSMTVFRGLELDLPRAEGVVQPETIVVTLDRDNRLIAAERVMESDQLVSWAMAEHSRTGFPVLIRGDREADLGVALELLAELQKAGLEAVSFQVEVTTGQQAETEGAAGPPQGGEAGGQ
jgi:biopolymer transport protein ExbD